MPGGGGWNSNDATRPPIATRGGTLRRAHTEATDDLEIVEDRVQSAQEKVVLAPAGRRSALS